MANAGHWGVLVNPLGDMFVEQRRGAPCGSLDQAPFLSLGLYCPVCEMEGLNFPAGLRAGLCLVPGEPHPIPGSGCHWIEGETEAWRRRVLVGHTTCGEPTICREAPWMGLGAGGRVRVLSRPLMYAATSAPAYSRLRVVCPVGWPAQGYSS